MKERLEGIKKERSDNFFGLEISEKEKEKYIACSHSLTYRIFSSYVKLRIHEIQRKLIINVLPCDVEKHRGQLKILSELEEGLCFMKNLSKPKGE